MKTVIPFKTSVLLFDDKVKKNEVCVVLKFFPNSDFSFDFKEVGFVSATVKDSVFFHSYFVQLLKKKYIFWFIENNLYKFFVDRSSFFFLSNIFAFKDFFSFFFFYCFIIFKNNNNVFFKFLITRNLIFFNFKQYNVVLLPLINLVKNIFFFERYVVDFSFLSYRKINLILQKNYSFFSTWWYFFSSLRIFLFYFIFKLYIYINFQNKLFAQCQLCFNQ